MRSGFKLVLATGLLMLAAASFATAQSRHSSKGTDLEGTVLNVTAVRDRQ